MTTAREIMTEGVETIAADATAVEAAECLSRVDAGAVPVCNDAGRLEGVVTDRDLVVKVLAAGKDPNATTVGDVADQAEVVTIGADDSLDLAVETMINHGVRRLPVIDGDQLVGMISQADLAQHCPPERVGELVAAISGQPSD